MSGNNNNTIKYIGIALAAIGGLGGLYAAFQGNWFWAFAGGILFIIGLFCIAKG